MTVSVDGHHGKNGEIEHKVKDGRGYIGWTKALPLNVRFGSQVQHGLNFLATTNVTGRDSTAIAHEIRGIQRREGFVGNTDCVEGPVDLEGAEVGTHVKLISRVGGVQDKVKLELVRLVPALLVGGDEALGSQGLGVGLLLRGVRQSVDIGAHGRGEQNTKVAQTAAIQIHGQYDGSQLEQSCCRENLSHSDNTNRLAGTDLGPRQRAV